VLLAGDLYDGDWKDYNTGLYFLGCMRRLRESGIRAFIITGNHDAASQITKQLRLPDNVTMFSTRKPESVVLDEWNVAIHGQGFATRAVMEDISQTYPHGIPQLFNIGMLHTCLNGKPGHDPYAPCTVDGLRSKGYQYWALGHVHTREEVSQQPWIVFPGNTQGRHIRETGPKGCTLVTVDNLEVDSVEHRDLDGAGLWLGKIVVQTRPTIAADGLLARDDAISGLSRAIQHLESDEIALAGLAGEVAVLRQKLPAELLSGEDRYDPTDPVELRLALADVRELLVNRLLRAD